MAWIDFKKAFDMVPKTWIINCLRIYNIYDKVIKFITEAIENWKVDLATGGKTLAEVKIQGDALSPILSLKL